MSEESKWPMDMSHVKFRKIGIEVPDGSPDEIRTTCPQCSHKRKNKTEKVLQVWVKDGNAYCHHCKWSPTIKGTYANAQVKIKVDSYVYAPLLPNMRDWFAGRGISPETLETYGVTWNVKFFTDIDATANCIQFPYRKGGDVVWSKYRTHKLDGKKVFTSSPNCEQPPYGYDDVKGKNHEVIVIVEGEIDKLSFAEAGYTNCISLPNGGIQPSEKGKPIVTDNKKLECLNYIEDEIKVARRIMIATDKDDVGELTREEIERRIGREKCQRVSYPEGCKDANDVLKNYGVEGVQRLYDTAEDIPISGLVSLGDSVVTAQFWKYYDEGYKPPVSTGLESLDWYFMPRAGEFTTVTGTPSAGKSVWTDFIAVNISRQYNWHWAVFSPESDPPARYYKRLAWIFMGKPFDKQYENRMSREEAEYAYAWVRKHFIVISREDHKADVGKVLELARMSVYRHGSEGLIIDPWNRFEHLVYSQGFHSETAYIAAMLDEMMTFTLRNALHTFLIAHPTKFEGQRSKYSISDNGGLDEKPVGLYGISGGANFYNMTYNGIVVHRNLLVPNSFKTKIIAEKIKHPGETGHFGEVDLRFDPFSCRYFDLPSEVQRVAKERAAEQARMKAAFKGRPAEIIKPSEPREATLDGIFF